MTGVQILLNTLFFLPAAAWLGGLVMLALASRQIDSSLQGRRTEAWQIVRRLRGTFQKIELGALAGMWIGSVGHMVMVNLYKDGYPGRFGPADAIKMGLMLIATIAALYSTFYVTGAIKAREEKIGSYSDKDGQTQVRHGLSLLHTQARAIIWLNIALGGLALLSAVVGLG